jgi:two-component system, NarL family, nitrate/nitrite response regulator NarL
VNVFLNLGQSGAGFSDHVIGPTDLFGIPRNRRPNSEAVCRCASAGTVRRAIAHRYGWLESAMATAYAIHGGAYCGAGAIAGAGAQIMLNPASGFQLDPVTGHLASSQVTQLMAKFLELIRVQQAAPPSADAGEWTSLNNGQLVEHARWLDGARLERLLGPKLSTSSVVLMPNQNIDSIGETVLAQQGHFVAILEMDRSFRSLADRIATIESLANAFLHKDVLKISRQPAHDSRGLRDRLQRRLLGESQMAKLDSRVEDDASRLPDMRQFGPAAPRVYLVSDVRLYREGLSASLAQRRQLELVGAGGSGDCLDRIVALQPEVLLLDLGARESLSIPRQAREVLPAIRVVAFAVAEIGENVLACAEAGISGYVTTEGSIEDLVAAVFHALRGELLCSPRMAALLFSRMATFSDGRITACADASSLTPREREIAALVACNLRNKEIARRLRLGPTTVKNHVHNILQKLNIHRRSEIARLHLHGNGPRADRGIQLMQHAGHSV